MIFESLNELHKIISGKYTDDIPARLIITLCDSSKSAYEMFTGLVNRKLAAENHEAVPSLSLLSIYDPAKIPDDLRAFVRVKLIGGGGTPIIMAGNRHFTYMFLQSGDMAGEAPVIEIASLEIRDVIAELEARDKFAGKIADILAWDCPYWMPVMRFRAGMESNFARGRIIVMLKKCAGILDETCALRDEKYYCSLKFSRWHCRIHSSPSWGYADGVGIVPEYGDDGNNLAGILLTLTIGDNASQTIELFTDSTQDNMSWTFSKSLTLRDGTEIDALEIVPFVKVSGSGEKSPVMYVHPSLEALGTDKAAIQEKFAWLNISWSSPNDWNHWSVIKDIKRRDVLREMLGDEAMRDFEADFAERFGKVYRVQASAGYEVSVRTPAAKLEELDRDFDGQEVSRDYAAEFVASVIEALRAMTGNPNAGGKS